MTPYTDEADERYMRMALAEARHAFDAGEIPIGAIVVADNGMILGRGHNMTEALGDVTAHAELQAITAAEQTLGGKYLVNCTLYVTVEPCLMCAGAISWAQISRIVYGAPDIKRGYSTLTSRPPFHPRSVIRAAVLADECATLMRSFFVPRR